jgi:DNA-binding beta-propeller fold protein YncE/HEAT repeat protein
MDRRSEDRDMMHAAVGRHGLRFAGAVAATWLVASGAATAAEATFAQPPAVAEDKNGVAITFVASAPADVSIRILDEQGKAVRHLAAGVLGKNPPAPLRPDSLAQSLVWDRRDDAGLPVPAGRYRIEVAVGLKPEFDRVIGWNPHVLGAVHGLAVGPKGTLYVMAEMGRDTREPRFVLLDLDGAYQRTLVPRSAALPLDRVRPLNELVLNDGTHIPQELLPEHGGRSYQQPIVMPNGDLVFLSGRSTGHNLGHRFYSVGEQETRPRRLLRLAADGGAPPSGYLGPVLGKGFDDGMLFLALAPDGETIYVSGARHAVFRVKWGEKERPVAVFGTPDSPGAGQTGLKDPQGIAFDRDGNLYVADRGNHRVVSISPAGKVIGQLAVEWPQHVLVRPTGGVLYVTAGFRQKTLLKFASLTDTQPAAKLDLRATDPILALDPAGDLYVANVPTKAGAVLVRVTDAGADLRLARALSEPGAVLQPRLLGVDRKREKVLAMAGPFGPYLRIDGRSLGAPETVENPLHAKANGISEMSLGATGVGIVHVKGEMGRFDANEDPLPFAVSGTSIARLPGDDCPRSFYDRGSCIAPNGDIYWVHERGGYSKPMLVTVLNADGSVKMDPLITFESRSPAAVRVDRAGNVYVLDHLKPLGQVLPEAFAGQVRIERTNRFVYNYGSVLKFRPEGGAIRQLAKGAPPAKAPDDGRPHFTTAEGRGHFAGDGVLWSYFGVSMIQPALDRVGCQCWHPRFDIDDFARVFVPDQLRSTIHVLDTNGNPICDFGRYGNVDDPGVAFADPRSVMVSREAAYVGDMANNRTVRVRLAYAAQASVTVDVPAPAPLKVVNAEAQFADPSTSSTARRGILAAVAAARVFEVRAEAVRLSPFLDKAIDWTEVEDRLTSSASLPGADAGRAALGLSLRDLADWPPAEAKALLGAWLKDPSDKTRLAAVWALWRAAAGPETKPLLRAALNDPSPLVRVTAADTLLTLDDPAGLAEVFKAARSDDPDVYKLAETAILKKVVVWNDEHPQARLLDPSAALVPKYAVGPAEVQALVPLLDAPEWYLRRAVIFLLALSGRPEAGAAFHARLSKENDRNLNRTIAALGLLRVRAAVPDLLQYVARGRDRKWGTDDYNGDQAETFAAEALVRIGDPAAVAPLTALLTSDRPTVPDLARRTLSRMFDPDCPADRLTIPQSGQLVRVRIDELPPFPDLQAVWKAFWTANEPRYELTDKGLGLKETRRQGSASAVPTSGPAELRAIRLEEGGSEQA